MTHAQAPKDATAPILTPSPKHHDSPGPAAPSTAVAAGDRQFRKRPAIIEAITFDEIVAYGLAHTTNIVRGMPWSFHYKGQPITHENDDCYLIPAAGGSAKLRRGDWLCSQMVNGKIDLWPVAGDIFAATYEPVAAPTRADSPPTLPITDAEFDAAFGEPPPTEHAPFCLTRDGIGHCDCGFKPPSRKSPPIPPSEPRARPSTDPYVVEAMIASFVSRPFDERILAVVRDAIDEAREQERGIARAALAVAAAGRGRPRSTCQRQSHVAVCRDVRTP